MEAEKRGKYAGVKLHLDEKESQEILDWYKLHKKWKKQTPKEAAPTMMPVGLAVTVAKAIKTLLKTHPEALTERTPEQIKAALLSDQAKIEKQLKAGKKWKEVE